MIADPENPLRHVLYMFHLLVKLFIVLGTIGFAFLVGGFFLMIIVLCFWLFVLPHWG